MAEHKHGSMDAKTHEATFAGFVNFSKWVVIVVLCVLIFMALVNG